MSRWPLVLVVLLAVVGCGGGSSDEPEPAASRTNQEPSSSAPAPASDPDATCPAGLSNCRTASGRILYIEAVDPDGDGDAHFVLASRESITAPGVSVIDVRQDLRPDPLPRPGDRISAAGPVYPGTYGQKQIEAVVLNSDG